MINEMFQKRKKLERQINNIDILKRPDSIIFVVCDLNSNKKKSFDSLIKVNNYINNSGKEHKNFSITTVQIFEDRN